jgi:hypothetical protein
VYLGHRRTGDLDVFVHDREDMRALAAQLPAVADETGTGICDRLADALRRTALGP